MTQRDPLDRHQTTLLLESEASLSTPPHSPRTDPAWQLWKLWLRLTGPRPERFGNDLAGRERLRRSRLISVLLVVIATAVLLIISGSVFLPELWLAALVVAGFGTLAAVLNRLGQVTLSGLVFILLVDSGVIEYILTRSFQGDPQDPGLTSTTVSAFHLLTLAIMMAGMVLPTFFIPLTGLFQVGVILFIFSRFPHNALLTLEIQRHNADQGYLVIQGPIISQVCGAGVVWLYSWSVNQALLRASRAEELAAARARINEQARQLAEQKQRLEQGIHALQEVQAQVANGDYSARASLQGNELLPLAVSFNMMAERLSHDHQLAADHRRLERALEQLQELCNALVRGMALPAFRATGTLVDRLVPALSRLSQQKTSLLQGSQFADDLRALLQNQQAHLDQVESQLISGLTLARALKEPLDLTGTRSPEHLQAILPPFLSTLTEQITLLERADKACTQAHELGRHCLYGARILSQRLKESA